MCCCVMSVSTSKLIRFTLHVKEKSSFTFHIWICIDEVNLSKAFLSNHGKCMCKIILWTCCEQEVNVSKYITLLHLTTSAIWQTHGWHGAQRNMDDNRCHPSHTVPPRWARLGRRVKKQVLSKRTNWSVVSVWCRWLTILWRAVWGCQIELNLVCVAVSVLVSSRTSPSSCPQGEKKVSESIIRGTTLEGNFKAAFQHSLGGGDGVN